MDDKRRQCPLMAATVFFHSGKTLNPFLMLC